MFAQKNTMKDEKQHIQTYVWEFFITKGQEICNPIIKRVCPLYDIQSHGEGIFNEQKIILSRYPYKNIVNNFTKLQLLHELSTLKQFCIWLCSLEV